MSFCRIFFTLLLFSSSGFAYTLTVSDRGEPVRLRHGTKLMLAGNPKNDAVFPAERFRAGVVRALQHLSHATRGVLDFEYWQGTDPAHYPSGLALNGLSSISFASNSRTYLDPNVIGYTQLWFNQATGDIIESDLVLNDRNYSFTSNPSDTTSQGRTTRPKVYLDSTITHELGHAIGLGHSGDLNSSMLFVEFLEQFRLGCDDVAGARHLYGTPSASGSLSGVVASPTRDPVAGAQVTAISRSTGLPIASAVTDRSGRFLFGALDAGSVGLVVQPYPGPPDSISSEHAPRNLHFCETRPFPIQFFTSEDTHTLLEFQLEPGRRTDAGTRVLQCAPLEPSGGTRRGDLSPEFLVDSSPMSRPVEYSFLARGEFTVTALTHLLLSPVRMSLEAFDERGSRIPVETLNPIYSSESGFKIAETRIRGIAHGKITLRATALPASSAPYPAFSMRLQDTPFHVLTFQSGFTENNPRCQPGVSFPEYLSPPGNPIRYSTTTSARERIGFCGTPEARADDGSAHASSGFPGAGILLGWFWPFLWIAAFQLNSIRRRARLKSCRSDSSRYS